MARNSALLGCRLELTTRLKACHSGIIFELLRTLIFFFRLVGVIFKKLDPFGELYRHRTDYFVRSGRSDGSRQLAKGREVLDSYRMVRGSMRTRLFLKKKKIRSKMIPEFFACTAGWFPFGRA